MLSQQGKPITFALCPDGIHSYFSGQGEVCVSDHDILIQPPNRNQGAVTVGYIAYSEHLEQVQCEWSTRVKQHVLSL